MSEMVVDAALVSERGDRPMNRITVVIDSKELDDILRKHFASAFPGMEFESCDSPSYSNSLTEILVHLKRKDEGGAALGSERGAERMIKTIPDLIKFIEKRKTELGAELREARMNDDGERNEAAAVAIGALYELTTLLEEISEV